MTWEPEAIFHGALRYRVSLGSDAVGNMIRLDNALSGFPGRIADTAKELESLESGVAAACLETEKPFPYADELREKSARLTELNVALNMDMREDASAIVMDDTEQEIAIPADERPERSYRHAL